MIVDRDKPWEKLHAGVCWLGGIIELVPPSS